MTTYVCCICMKSLEKKFVWKELRLSEEVFQDPEIDILAYEALNELGETNYENIAHPADGVVRAGNTVRDEKGKAVNWSAIVSTPCGHLYHLGCIYAWMNHLEKRGWELSCAYCRQQMYNVLELVYIYPVSCKSVEDEDTDNEGKDNLSQKHRKKGKVEKLPDSEQQQTDRKEETPTPYCDRKFWVTVGMTLMSIALYLTYLQNGLQLLESEEYEETEFDPIFGSVWTFTVFLCTLSALFMDSKNSINKD